MAFSRVFALSLTVLLLLKVWDLIVPMPAGMLYGLLILWVGVTVALLLRYMPRSITLPQAAASLDHKAALSDEMKSALWFVEQSKSSSWIDVQVSRASATARRIAVEDLYPRTIPRAAYLAGVAVFAQVLLNSVPLLKDRSWFDLQPSRSAASLPEVQTPAPPSNSTAAGNGPALSSTPEKLSAEETSELAGDAQVGKVEAEPFRLDQLNSDDISELSLASGGTAAAAGGVSQAGLQTSLRLLMEASSLKVQFERVPLSRKQELEPDPSDIKPTEKNTSKLFFRYPAVEIRPAERDVMNLRDVPWEYHGLVKGYFDAINRGNNSK